MDAAAAVRMQPARIASPGADAAPNAGALCPNAGALDAPKGLAAVAPNPPNAGLAPKALVAPNAGALDAPNEGWLCCPKAGVAPNAGAGDAPKAGWLCRCRAGGCQASVTVHGQHWRGEGAGQCRRSKLLSGGRKRAWPKTPVVVAAPNGEVLCPNAGVCWPKGEGEVAPKGLELAPKPAAGAGACA